MTPAGNSRPRLVALNTPMRGQEFFLAGASATLGRSAECEIILDQASVSRLHARVEERDGRYFVRDLGSRNGIKIGGRQVHDGELRSGDVLTVGDVQLYFDLAGPGSPSEAETRAPASEPAVLAPAVRPLSAGDIMAVAQPAVRSPGEAFPPSSVQEGTAPRIGLNVKLIAAIVLALLLSAGVGVLILRMVSAESGPRIADLGPVLLRVGENKWLSCRRYGDFQEADISNEDENVADVRRYDAGELLITGKGGGDTNVSFTTTSGVPVSVRVLVRGRIEDPLEDLTYGRFTPSERVAMGERFFEGGRAIEAENPYLAHQQYEKAVTVLKPLNKPTGLYLQAKMRLDATARAVDARWNKLRGDIIIAIQNNDRQLQMQLLEEVLKLIPDPNDPRHQKAAWRMRGVIREELAEKEHRGSS